ncbi:hypothetical protein [Corallococcus llansteffanensis]|uniref:Uncharacterized protein n=1 Tax=Corallococcus llansteffanensis TaxID=2316731 RepID=A0A3A8PG50_9BACT|nr:hypothetical protein [Corallococcus llansteffanensis]RKH54989.1 hypothetical protein D7V93_24180 [Corallococcus llansteffanensis]
MPTDPDAEKEQPRRVVLYHPKPLEGWRYAVYTEPLTILDGRLLECPPSAPFEEARTVMLQHLTRIYGGHYTLRWEEDEPGWWTGHVVDPAP